MFSSKPNPHSLWLSAHVSASQHAQLPHKQTRASLWSLQNTIWGKVIEVGFRRNHVILKLTLLSNEAALLILPHNSHQSYNLENIMKVRSAFSGFFQAEQRWGEELRMADDVEGNGDNPSPLYTFDLDEEKLAEFREHVKRRDPNL